MLERYACHKVVSARPMSFAEFYCYKHPDVTVVAEPENADKPGYLVVYNIGTDDEYESWSPKKQFDDGYTSMSGSFSFSDALRFMLQGRRVARKNWNASGQFAFYVPPERHPSQSSELNNLYPGGSVCWSGHFALRTVSGYVASWVPSSTDLIGDDWHLVL